MPATPETSSLSVGQFVERHRRDLIPLSKTFSYLAAPGPLTEEDVREYLEDPIAALPPAIAAKLPRISILLVPYLEKNARERGKNRSGEMVRLDPPHANNVVPWTSCMVSKDETVLAFAVEEQEVADYHYYFFHLLAKLTAEHWAEEARRRYTALLQDELAANVHGEVDEQSWHLKAGIVRRQSKTRRESKLLTEYAKQSFIDTLTLYLHGICCDIDVETGPRQLQSRYLRKRLQLFRELYPPPEGYSVFPEDVRS